MTFLKKKTTLGWKATLYGSNSPLVNNYLPTVENMLPTKLICCVEFCRGKARNVWTGQKQKNNLESFLFALKDSAVHDLFDMFSQFMKAAWLANNATRYHGMRVRVSSSHEQLPWILYATFATEWHECLSYFQQYWVAKRAPQRHSHHCREWLNGTWQKNSSPCCCGNQSKKYRFGWMSESEFLNFWRQVTIRRDTSHEISVSCRYSEPTLN